MTETRFTWRWLFVVAALGLVGGVVLGLIVGWVFPISSSSVDASGLSASAQNDYIVLVANSYAFDSDLDLAKQRLGILKDSNIKGRVERLAKSLSAKKDPDATNVADLAVGLGSTDSALKVLAASVVNNTTDTSGEPTKVARVQIDPTRTPKPTVAATNTVAATATIEQAAAEEPSATATKAKSAAPKTTNTPKPAATNPPAPAAALQPVWTPSKDQWWPTIQYQPASVAAGQQYWRLVSALYCEPQDANPDPACANKPGGGNDYTMYISLIDQSGKRTEGELVIQNGDGSPSDEGTLPKVKSAGDMCNCN